MTKIKSLMSQSSRKDVSYEENLFDHNHFNHFASGFSAVSAQNYIAFSSAEATETFRTKFGSDFKISASGTRIG